MMIKLLDRAERLLTEAVIMDLRQPAVILWENDRRRRAFTRRNETSDEWIEIDYWILRGSSDELSGRIGEISRR